MDKYELSIKEDKIKKHAEKKDYAAAVKIADTIDWSKVRNIKMLTLVSQVYENAKNYTEAKNILLLAYERVPMGRRMLYKLTELSVKEGKLEEAESYFEEFEKVAPNDINKLLLAYQIEVAKGADVNGLIAILESYRENEFEEKWAYELANLYHEAGRAQECVRLCNDIILWFGVGSYVDKALNLKMQYEPLTPAEREKLVNKKKFEARVRAVGREFEKREYQGVREDESEALEQRREREQRREVAMTRETVPGEEPVHGEEAAYEEEIFPVEEMVFEQAFSGGEETSDQEMDWPEEEPENGRVISFPSARPEEEDVSAAAERMFFAKEPLFAKKPEVRPLSIGEEAAKSPVAREEEAADSLGGEWKDQLFDMQESLAQSVQAAEMMQEPLESPESCEGDDLLGHTKEVVKETRKALNPEREPDPEEGLNFGEGQALGEEDGALRDMQAALAAEAFPEEHALPAEEAAATEENQEMESVISGVGPAFSEPEFAESPGEEAKKADLREESEQPIENADMHFGEEPVLPAGEFMADGFRGEDLAADSEGDQEVFEENQEVLEEGRSVIEGDQEISEEGRSVTEEDQAVSGENPEVLGGGRSVIEGDQEVSEGNQASSGENPEVLEEGRSVTEEGQAVSGENQRSFKEDGKISGEAPEEELPAEESGDFEITCVVVESEEGPGRIPFAVEKLKKTHEVLGSKAIQVAKISGEKLSAKGVHNTFSRLAGRDLIVDHAAELSHEAAAELAAEIESPSTSLVLILLDTAEGMDKLLVANPELDRLCVYLEEGGQMDVDEFVACASKYAREEECVMEEMANLALYAAAERIRDNGGELTEETAKRLVDEAIDRAEHRGIKGLFGSKYDKEGYLILKEQFFKNL